MSKPRICLIEPCHSHTEVVVPTLDLLYEAYEIYLIAPRSLFELDLLRSTQSLYRAVPIDWQQRHPRWRRFLRMPAKYFTMRQLVNQIAPCCVFFTSTYREIDLLLIARYFKHVPKAQIIHNFQYFLRPGMHRLYEQFDLNLVISEEVHKYILEHHPQYASLDYFLPISFDCFFRLHPLRNPSGVPTGPIQLGVFGAVDQGRRNYEGLFQSLRCWRRKSGAAPFVVHIVGKLPKEYRRFIARYELDELVRYYDHYVSFEEMFRVLRMVDIVLFLIDSTSSYRQTYNRYKISGSSNLIKGFRKVCASSRDFPVESILRDKCFFYDGAQLEQLFEAIADGYITREVVREKEARYTGLDILSREEQQSRLLSGLRRSIG